jgi:hypothetical protein
MSARPSSLRTRAASASQSSGDVMSHTTCSARRPNASTSGAHRAMRFSRRAAITMSAPSAARASEMSRPMPGPSPDTTATLPSNIPMCASPDDQ